MALFGLEHIGEYVYRIDADTGQTWFTSAHKPEAWAMVAEPIAPVAAAPKCKCKCQGFAPARYDSVLNDWLCQVCGHPRGAHDKAAS